MARSARWSLRAPKRAKRRSGVPTGAVRNNALARKPPVPVLLPPGWSARDTRDLRLINEIVQLLAQAPRQGAVHLGVGAGRAISSALGAAEAEAAQVAVNLGTRERLGHKVCWVLCAQHLM